jgi:hypothetical protein
MEAKPKDISLEETIAQAGPLIARGCTIHQKFTCSLCQSRQVIDEPNVIYASAKCELCGTVTNLQKTGCGFMLLGPTDKVLRELIRKSTKEA